MGNQVAKPLQCVLLLAYLLVGAISCAETQTTDSRRPEATATAVATATSAPVQTATPVESATTTPATPTPPQVPMADDISIDEYASVFCTPPDLPPNPMWGELLEVYRLLLEETEDIRPPARLADFHEAAVKRLRESLRVVEQQAPTAPANPAKFALDDFWALAHRERLAAIQAMDTDDRALLRAAGCTV